MDYYSTLGVDRNASQDDIKKAFRKLSMKHHPDRGGDEKKFKELNEAYATLSDAQKKQEYDNPQSRFQFNTSNMNGFDPRDPIFDTFFGQGFRRQQRSQDITLAVNINLEDVIIGKNMIITYQLPTGFENSVDINIPIGAQDGDTIRFQGLGGDAIPGHRGDLFVKIRINTHPRFRKDGAHLYLQEKINVFTMMLGGQHEIKTLDKKKLNVNIPKGMKSNSVLNLAGQGLPDRRTGRKGNLYLEIIPDIPNITDSRLIQKIQELKDEMS